MTTKVRGHVFLSHSSVDKTLARRLARRLQHCGIDVWLDVERLRIGDRLDDVLRDQIQSSSHVIVLASQPASSSQWVEMEVDAARSADNPPVIIPIFTSPEIKGHFMTDVRGVDIRRFEFESLLNMLARSLDPGANLEHRDRTLLATHHEKLLEDAPQLRYHGDPGSLADVLRNIVTEPESNTLETFLWVEYEMRSGSDRAMVATAAGAAFRRWGVGFELLRDHVRKHADREEVWWCLRELTSNALARANTVSAGLDVLDEVADPLDVHHRWFARANVQQMEPGHVDRVIGYVVKRTADREPAFDIMALADLLFRRLPEDARLQSSWLRIVASCPNSEMRQLLGVLDDAARDGLGQYAPIIEDFRSRVRNLAREPNLERRKTAMSILVSALRENYHDLKRLVEVADGSISSIEWKDIEVPPELELVFRGVVMAAKDRDEGKANRLLLELYEDH